MKNASRKPIKKAITQEGAWGVVPIRARVRAKIRATPEIPRLGERQVKSSALL